MFGYPRHGMSGCPAARLDDAANFLPARLRILFVLLATRLRSERVGGGVRIGLGDCRNYASHVLNTKGRSSRLCDLEPRPRPQ